MDDKKDLFTGEQAEIDALLDDETFIKEKRNEADKLDDGMFTGGELSEDDDLDDGMFTGGELSEDDALRKNIHPSDFKAGIRQKPSDNVKKKKIAWKWPMIMGIMALVLIMGALGGFIIYDKRQSQHIVAQAGSSLMVSIPPKKEIWLKDFLIPLNPTHLYTCVTFSVVVRSWEDDFISPLTHEKQWLRGRLYAILVEKIQNEVDTPSLETFRQWVQQAVRHVLPNSHIISVDIHQFLVV